MHGTLEHRESPPEIVTIQRGTVEKFIFALVALGISAFLGTLTYMARDVVTEMRSLRQDFATVSVWQARVDAILEIQNGMLTNLQQVPDAQDFQDIRDRLRVLEEEMRGR